MLNNNESSPVRVLLVEDSILQLHIIKSYLNNDSRIQVVGTAENGVEALKILPNLKPDVICTDYHMPEMDGLEFIKHAVQVYPCPILVLSISVQPDQVDNIFKMLSAGAIDVLPKPMANGGVIGKEEGAQLVDKILILNGVKYIKKKSGQSPSNQNTKCRIPRIVSPKIIVMGASTGGPQALEVILSNLKDDFSIPIVCIQHISHGFLGGMLTWLESISKLVIEIAKDGCFPLPGHLYFPPEGSHLTFRSDGAFVLTAPKFSDLYCPSIDQLFNSAARVYSSDVEAVILSGMGKDGASGMKSIFEAGGDTIAQDEDTSIIFGMPAEAINSSVVCNVLPVAEIAPYLNSFPRIES